MNSFNFLLKWIPEIGVKFLLSLILQQNKQEPLSLESIFRHACAFG
jgi:hypothetical protein